MYASFLLKCISQFSYHAPDHQFGSDFYLPRVIPFQELEDPLILIHEKKISSINAVVKVLELALKVGCLLMVDSYLLIFANGR